MLFSSLVPLWALVAFLFYGIISFWIANRRHAARARELGCEPPPRLPNMGLLGIRNVREMSAADKEKRVPDFLLDRIRESSRMNGRFVSTGEFEILESRGYFTCDPKNIQALLAHQFKDFGLGETRIGNFYPLLGHGIFASDGKKWEHSRALLRPQFAREQVSDLDLEERHVQNMMRVLPTQSDGWTAATDVQVLFFRLTLDSATEFLFGESVDSQIADFSNRDTEVSAHRDERIFAYAFDRSQWHLSKRARFMDQYWLADSKEFRQCCKQVHDFVDHFVQLALNHDLKEKELEKGSGTRKDRYVFLEQLAAETRDPIEIRNELLNILLAGRDTTASLLGWLVLMLVKHPDEFAKLRAAIINDFGTYTNPEEITFSKLKNCQYLQYCLNETLRLYPVVPLNSRRALVDTTIPRGGGPDGLSPIYVRKGQEVNYSVHVMHRRKDLWGEDADLFRPERWIGRRPGWEYLPFNGGPRICLGQQFALTEAGYVTVRLLQRFDGLQGVGISDTIRHGLTLTSCPADGVTVKLREARE